MHMDIKARGFTITPALQAAVHREAAELAERVGRRPVHLQVRLFDVNGVRGGVDKGCLVAARIGRRKRVAVATDLNPDLYQAIRAAFKKLVRVMQAASRREHTLRRGRGGAPLEGYFSSGA